MQHPKFGLSVLAIFRNEAHVLREWLNHYQQFGVEHFYLINNNSSDGYEAVLKPYIKSGVVELSHCQKDGNQIGAYSALLPKLKSETRWLGVFDLDEFVYSPYHDTITEVVAGFCDYEAVLIPWLSFGSSGHIRQPQSVVHGFQRRGVSDTNRSFFKAISQPMSIQHLSQHNPRTIRGKKVLANGVEFGDQEYLILSEEDIGSYKLINNHYRLQSLDYFTTVKTCRPEVHEDLRDRPKKLEFFNEHDRFWNVVKDDGLARRSAAIKI